VITLDTIGVVEVTPNEGSAMKPAASDAAGAAAAPGAAAMVDID
jgi:hypothetical protein